MDVRRYRKKPVAIEAVQLDSGNASDVLGWILENGGEAARLAPATTDQTLLIHTLEGDHRASLGDWIIRGVAGEFYPCKPDIFDATYEPADCPPNGGVASELQRAADEGMGC